ncbi:galactose mutarotase [Periweissella cryptocerci]|uniref:Maltose epimerase n=1 Tax=Periweissella cryptocerci TaxID=2506420 RepID=A0A4P6YUC7_9LACO|nr:aldose epimerase family protein [Periweissella cryptocerci]QBO36340.1 galactose mutarotase [Periweissella cryptocerci]
MQIKTTDFGHVADGPVTEYTLINKNGVQVSAITFGATWRRFTTKDVAGNDRDLILNFPDVHEYETNPFHLGNTIGRVGGRIAGGEFSIAKQMFHVKPNEGHNLIHGGAKGFDTYNWHGQAAVVDGNGVITFTQTITDDGFAGTLDVTITYTLTETNQLTITYSGISDEATLFNPMTHVYFNLADGQASILDHQLQIRSTQHVAVDSEKIPTGEFIDNAGTAFDFATPAVISAQLAKLAGDQFDDAFVLTDAQDEAALVLTDPASGRTVEIVSDRNGAVVFTANPWVIGKDDAWIASHPYNGLALETQTLPDAVHHANFGDIVLPANTQKDYHVTYTIK